MAKTKQGPFDAKYHHIDAPTPQDDVFGMKYHRRKLIIPTKASDFRDPLVGLLADSIWISRRKLDGQNLRVMWDGEQALWNGKTNAFTCDVKLHRYMEDTFIEELFEDKFGRDKQVLLFGEHMGPKSQGNQLKLDHDEFVMFDVCVNGTWLSKADVRDVAKYFHIKTCYDYMDRCYPHYSLYDLIDEVARGKVTDWEGIVATPSVEARTQAGDRVIVKIKNKDYYVPTGDKKNVK